MNNREIAELRRRLDVAERELRTQRGIVRQTERAVVEAATDGMAVRAALLTKRIVTAAEIDAEKPTRPAGSILKA